MSLDLTKKINRVVVDGAEMTVVGVPHLQDKEVAPSTTAQSVNADTGYDALGTVTVSAVTNSIDTNIVAENIKSGVNILGITGTLEEGITPSGTLLIEENGNFDVTNYANAEVNVQPNLQEKTATSNGEVVADSGYDGLSKVTVSVPSEEPTLITKEITENGTYKASDDGADGYSEVVVNVAGGETEEEIDFDRVFGNNTPEQIQKVGNQIAVKGLTSAEVAETYGWKIGDTKDITLTTGEAIQMRIIGINHDTASAGGTAGITLDMVNCLSTKYPMNSTSTNSGGWEASKLRTQTLPSIKATLPTEWQNIITKVDKYCWDNNVTKTLSEDLFLMSAIEKRGNGIATEGTRYEYYVNTPYTQTVKYVGTSASVWWLRTPQGDFDFAIVLSDGAGGSVGASYSQGLSFAFCVGSKPVPVIAGLPIEVTTDQEMTTALTQDNLGKVYKFTGTSDAYETDAIYIVSEV